MDTGGLVVQLLPRRVSAGRALRHFAGEGNYLGRRACGTSCPGENNQSRLGQLTEGVRSRFPEPGRTFGCLTLEVLRPLSNRPKANAGVSHQGVPVPRKWYI